MLVQLYRKLLATAEVTESKEGLLTFNYGDEQVPLMVHVNRMDGSEHLPIVLPTEEVINMQEDGTLIKFHPFAESPFADQSEVFNKLQILLSGRICTVVQGLVSIIINISLDAENVGDYPCETIALIGDIPSVGKEAARAKVIKFADTVAKRHTSITGEFPVVRFNVGRRKRTDIDSIRWAELSMPVLDFDEEEMRIFGVKAPSRLAFNVVKEAYVAVLPKVEGYAINSFLTGTNETTAPYFISLLKSYALSIKHFNKISNKLGVFKDKAFNTSLNWIRLIEEADDLSSEIDIDFEGNIGVSSGKAQDLSNSTGSISVEAKPIVVEMEPTVAAPTIKTNTQQETAPMTTSKSNVNQFRKKALHASTSRPAPVTTVEQPEARTVAVKKPQGLQVERPAPKTQSASAKLTLERHERHFELFDSLGQPVLDYDGKQMMITAKDAPRGLFLVMTDVRGFPMYDDNYNPRLESITEAELREIKHHANMQGQGGYGQSQSRYPDPRQQLSNNNGYPQNNAPRYPQNNNNNTVYQNAPQSHYPDPRRQVGQRQGPGYPQQTQQREFDNGFVHR